MEMICFYGPRMGKNFNQQNKRLEIVSLLYISDRVFSVTSSEHQGSSSRPPECVIDAGDISGLLELYLWFTQHVIGGCHII